MIKQFTGYPNVGKSSVINSLKRAKACGVGSTPGFTKFVLIYFSKYFKIFWQYTLYTYIFKFVNFNFNFFVLKSINSVKVDKILLQSVFKSLKPHEKKRLINYCLLSYLKVVQRVHVQILHTRT